jgi:hypothetical protein
MYVPHLRARTFLYINAVKHLSWSVQNDHALRGFIARPLLKIPIPIFLPKADMIRGFRGALKEGTRKD